MNVLYRGMDRAALDAAYHNTGAVSDLPTIFAGFQALSGHFYETSACERDICYGQNPRENVSTADIANRRFRAALADAEAEGVDADALCRSLLSLIVSTYLETRTVTDVQSELRFVADNCNPDTDLAFMRP